MKLSIFVSAIASSNALPLTVMQPLPKECEELAQTDTQFIGRIFDLFESLFDHLMPLDVDQRMKSHGTRFNCVEANSSNQEHGGKMGGNHDKKAKPTGEDGKG